MKKNTQKTLRLTIGWLYPDLMSTYGDRGNIIALTRRCAWRNIETEIVSVDQETRDKDIKKIDLLFGGGAQDMEQDIVMRDLKGKKSEMIKQLIEAGKPALFVCGAPQIMGNFYEPAVGKRLEGLGIFDMETINPGPDKPRLIGNIVAEVNWDNLQKNVIANEVKQSHKIASSVAFGDTPRNDNFIVGFENHGGRTFLGPRAKPFAKVIQGFGNNGDDGTEGVVYKNAIGCYFHGPLLPKNPHIADFLVKRTLEIKYKREITLSPLDDMLEWQAHEAITKRSRINF